jgi:hypothetical protein
VRHVGRLVFPLSLDPGTSPAGASELPILQGTTMSSERTFCSPSRCTSSGGGPVRKVIVFRLRPTSITPPPSQSRFAEVLTGQPMTVVPVASHLTERFLLSPQRWSTKLSHGRQPSCTGWPRTCGPAGTRSIAIALVPIGEHKPLFTDVFDATTNVLVEGKGVATRDSVRMAIGLLADYVRWLDAPTCAILLPSRPRPDLEVLGHSQDIAFIWPSGGGFVASREGVV